jgi:hypothetical protein
MSTGLTATYGLSYPLSTDPVNIHGDLKTLADQLDLLFQSRASTGLSNTFSQPNIFSVGSTTDAVRISQTGTGNSLLVEDSANPDSTPFVIDASGNVGIGKLSPTKPLDVVGAGTFSGALTASTFNTLSLTSNTTGFSVAGGTTSKTLTINNSITLAGTDSTTITLPATSGTIPLNNQAFYIGTQSITINQGTGTITSLPGVTSINGSTIPLAGTWYTAPTIGSTTIASGTTYTTLPGVTSVNGTTIPSGATLVTSGANSNITSLSGLTTALSVAQGGTGTGTVGIAAFNNITGYTSSGATGTTSTNIVFSTSPTITTPVIDTINISALGTSGSLWNTTMTTGSISMGGALTTGGINIATGTAFNGTVSIASGAGTVNKTINIGTSSTTGTTAITLGSSAGATSTIALQGSVASVRGVSYFYQPAVTALTATATLTIAQLLTEVVTVTSTTAVTLTLPTAALMDGGVPTTVTAVTTSAFDWSVINLGSSAGAVTMAAGTSHTYVGSTTVAIGTSARFRSVRTAATPTWITYRIS